jgi:DNA-binding transcriptional ArsR family regulator
MDAPQRAGDAASRIAAAIGEPARSRMLYCLMDNRARTGAELAAVAEVSPSTASVHLNRLRAERLVTMLAQGKHRYYRLEGSDVARVLEGLSILAGGPRGRVAPNTPSRLCAARTCYDHLAGTLGVLLHDRLNAMGWLRTTAKGDRSCHLTPVGNTAFASLGIDLDAARAGRRGFAFGCLDWSERRFHLGGALGAALLSVALNRGWVAQDPDSRALRVTGLGRREMRACFGIVVPE